MDNSETLATVGTQDKTQDEDKKMKKKRKSMCNLVTLTAGYGSSINEFCNFNEVLRVLSAV